MNVLSKIKNDDKISIDLENDLYPLRCMIVTALSIQITKGIYTSHRNFYNKHIITNIAFKDIIEFLKSKSIQKIANIGDEFEDEHALLILILFVFEEFVHAWTSPSRNSKLDNAAIHMEIFRKFVNEVKEMDITDYASDIQMIAREKPIQSISFQLIYIFTLILPSNRHIGEFIVNHVNCLLNYYLINQTIEPIVGPFDQEYLRMCLIDTYFIRGIEHTFKAKLITKYTNFKVDITKFVNMIVYAWVVRNQYTLKSYNETILKLFTSSQYQIKQQIQCKSSKELAMLYKIQHQIVNCTGKYKYVEVADSIAKKMKA